MPINNSELKFQEIFSQSPVGIEIYDIEGNLIDVNPKCLDIFGVNDKQEIIGFNLFADPNVPKDAKKQLMKHEPVSYEVVFDFDLVIEHNLYNTSKSGKSFLDCIIYPYQTPEVSFQGFIVHVQDITERKMAEKAHRETTNYLRTVLNNAPITIFATDKQGRFTLSEGKGLESVGLKPGENVGVSAFDLYRSLTFELYNGNVITGEDVIRRALAGETVNAISKLGDVYFDNSIGPLYCDEGNIIGLVGIATDITNQKLLKNKLIEIMTLLENVYASLDEAVFVVNPETRIIISCNNASERMFGYPKEKIIGRNTEFLHVNKKMYREFGEMLSPALDASGIFYTEYNMQKKDGTIFPTEHTVKEVRDNSGHHTMNVSVVRDVTKKKKTINDLKKNKAELNEKNLALEELNTALKVLLKQREKEKKESEESLIESIHNLILPYIKRFKKTNLSSLQQEYITILESNLREITKPYMHKLSDKMMHLSPSEIRIVTYVRQGFSNKDIASILNVSPRTIEYHRDNIRKKLGIKNRKTNLKTYLDRIS